MIPLYTLVLVYVIQSIGELCLSPVGLSMVTKLAPLRLASLMMGVWFLINFVANWLSGIIGSFAEQLGELAIFGGIATTLFVFSVVLWLFSGTLVRWMHGAEKVTH
jgi:POT family proton-dependent oligopeptide transporter